MKKHRHDLGCLRVGRTSRSPWTCLVTGEKIPTQPVWKQATGLSCPHGQVVFQVNGSHVRNKFDSDFDQGSNGYRSKFIPKHEIWIDSHVPKAEWPYIIAHECYEIQRMKAGWSYERAHTAAKRIENKVRRRDRPGE